MEVESPINGSEQVSCEDARAELERLLADSRFHITERNRAFLRYIADETFSGQSKGVKAYSIAIDVFGRASNFDPNTDPIVRIEAARLRAALDQYYESHGSPGGVRINLPRGNYIAEFSHIPDDAAVPADDRFLNQPPDEAGSRAATTYLTARPARSQHYAMIGMMTAIAAIWAGGVIILRDRLRSSVSTPAIVTGKPQATIVTSARGAGNGDQIEDLNSGLLMALSRFGTLRFAIGDANDSDMTARTRSLAFPTDADSSLYRISVKYDLEDEPHSAIWQIVDPQSGETLASGEEKADESGQNPDRLGQKLVSALAIRFGSNMGILNGIERDKAYPADAEGNICVLRAEYAINTYDRPQMAAARSCLQQTVAANDRLYDAKAVLARILVIEDEWNGEKTNLPAASTLADEATTGAPSSDRSQLARMYVLFASGQLDAAFATGRSLIERNPLNADAAASLALRLYFSGSNSEGLEIASHVVGDLDATSRAANLVLAFDAYQNGDGREALRRLDIIANEGMITRYIRVASLVRLGMRDEASAAFDTAVRLDPQFASHLPQLSRVRHFNAEMNARIARDIATARDWSYQNKTQSCAENIC